MIGKCKLCFKNKELCKQSHIIPNFMYNGVFDDDHTLIRFQDEEVKTVCTGEFEREILCYDCDNKVIGGLETYAKKALYGGDIPVKMNAYKLQDGLKYLQLDGLDYKKFKLFLLSVLWRASISNRDFFKAVSLGSYEKVIGKMLIDSNPGSYNNFPCLISSYVGNELQKIVAGPKKIRFGNAIGYAFYINGLMYYFRVSHSIEEDKIFLETTINQDGKMKVIIADNEVAKESLLKFLSIEK